eukprot:scaffold3053_cov214-Prasinococcus_capsulatus_cf.AAC.4
MKLVGAPRARRRPARARRRVLLLATLVLATLLLAMLCLGTTAAWTSTAAQTTAPAPATMLARLVRSLSPSPFKPAKITPLQVCMGCQSEIVKAMPTERRQSAYTLLLELRLRSQRTASERPAPAQHNAFDGTACGCCRGQGD